jgi:hypothetical protein
MPNWKWVMLRSAGFGAGFSVLMFLILIGWNAYQARPKIPEPWNTAAITVERQAVFSASEDGKWLVCSYFVKNTTFKDYRLENTSPIILAVRGDGFLSRPAPEAAMRADLPWFVPASQTGMFTIRLRISDIPVRQVNDSDSTYNQRVQQYVLQRFKDFDAVVLFDEENRYQIDLPLRATGVQKTK